MGGISEPDTEEIAPRDQIAAAMRDVDAYEELVRVSRAYASTLRLSDPPADVLGRVAGLVQQATELLSAHPGDVDRMTGATGPFVPTGAHRKEPGEKLAWHFSFSPVVGTLNPQSAPIEMTFDGERIRGRAIVDARFGGPPHTVHGGVVALIFDELLGNTNYCLGLGAMTGTLSDPLPAAHAARPRARARGMARPGRGPEDLHAGHDLGRRRGDGQRRRRLPPGRSRLHLPANRPLIAVSGSRTRARRCRSGTAAPARARGAPASRRLRTACGRRRARSDSRRSDRRR